MCFAQSLLAQQERNLVKPLNISEGFDALDEEIPNPNVASPKLKTAYYGAEALYQAENFHDAQKAYQRIIDSFSKEPINTPFLGGTYYRLAQIKSSEYTYINTKEKVETHAPDKLAALEILQYAINIKSNNPDFLYFKAALLYESNQAESAALLLMNLASADPHSFTFHHYAAIALSRCIKVGPNPQLQAQRLLAFCDTWTKHLGNTEKVIQFRNIAIANREATSNVKPNEAKNNTTDQNKDVQSVQNRSIISPNQTAAPLRFKALFQECLTKKQWFEAHQFADSLENFYPIFTAHTLVHAYQNLSTNKIEQLENQIANSIVETDIFIQQQYLRLKAMMRTKLASEDPNFSNPKLPESLVALALWIDLYNQKVFIKEDLPLAISIAEKTQSIQYIEIWKQMAQDLKIPPTTK